MGILKLFGSWKTLVVVLIASIIVGNAVYALWTGVTDFSTQPLIVALVWFYFSTATRSYQQDKIIQQLRKEKSD